MDQIKSFIKHCRGSENRLLHIFAVIIIESWGYFVFIKRCFDSKIILIVDKIWEKLRKVDFAEHIPNSKLGIRDDQGNYYAPISTYYYFGLRKLFKDISKEDIILDLGCGKGKAMWMFSKFRFGHISGVEINDGVAGIAKNNLKQLGLDESDFSIYTMDGALFEDYDLYNWIYLYNTFPEKAMISVVKNIESSLARKPRNLKILYNIPDCIKQFENSMYFVSAEFVYKNLKLVELSNKDGEKHL